MKILRMKSLKTQILRYFVPISLAAVLIMCLFSCIVFGQEILHTNLENVQSITDNFAQNINNELSSLVSPMAIVAYNENIQTVLGKRASDVQANIYASRNFQQMTKNITSRNYCVSVYVIGPDGICLSSNPNVLYNYDFFAEDWFADTIADCGVSRYSSVHYPTYAYDYRTTPVISLVMPLGTGHCEASENYIICDVDITKLTRGFPSDMRIGRMTMEILEEDQPILSPGSAVSGHNAIVIESSIPISGWKIAVGVDRGEFFLPFLKILLITLAVCLVICTCSFLALLQISHAIQQPIDMILQRIEVIKAGDLEPRQVDYGNAEIRTIGTELEVMLGRIRRLIRNVGIYQTKNQRLEYDALVNQISPHFLSNTLQMISRMAIQNDSQDILDVIEQLSYLLRYYYSSDSATVTIREELQMLESYLFIMKLRFPRLFTYEVHCPEELYSHRIIKYCLQPVVENCFKHGFSDMSEGGVLTIHIYEKDSRIHSVITDNGRGFGPDFNGELPSSDSSIGLANTNKRLQLFYGPEYGLLLRPSPSSGAEVECILPSEEREEMTHV